MSIDNNIFGYENYGKIKLISICDELLLYKGKLNVNKEEATISIKEVFDANHTLLQNKDIEKEEDKLYSLEYQFLVKEPNYEAFYSMPNFVYSSPVDYDAEQYYNPRTFEGRTNILTFKLCHKYCIKCTEYGHSYDNQKCLNCKEQCSYDYLNYVKKFTGNCIPYDQMYDIENKKLLYCNTTHFKYYYNKTKNSERFCFKYDYECPNVYPYLNISSNECLDYTPPKPTTIIIQTPSTILPIPTKTIIKKESSTNIIQTPTTSKNIEASTILPKIITNNPNIIDIKNDTMIDIQSTFPKIISTINNQDICKYDFRINLTSLYSNLTDEKIFELAKENIINNYCFTGSGINIEGSNSNSFQLSNTYKELQLLHKGNDSFVIDLKECENILKINMVLTIIHL